MTWGCCGTERWESVGRELFGPIMPDYESFYAGPFGADFDHVRRWGIDGPLGGVGQRLVVQLLCVMTDDACWHQ